MKVGDFSEFLHAFSVGNGEIGLHEDIMTYRGLISGLDEALLQQIEKFISKIARQQRLEKIRPRLVSVPHRNLHAVSFGAVRIQIGECEREGKYLGDVFA